MTAIWLLLFAVSCMVAYLSEDGEIAVMAGIVAVLSWLCLVWSAWP